MSPDGAARRFAARLAFSALPVVLVLALTGVSGCGSSPATVSCAQLTGRLQQVTQVLGTSSELIANSVNPQQLSQRIATEQEALRQSASFMGSVRPPAAVAAADRRLVAALRAFSADFGRAAGPAARGDFQAATADMGDKPVVQQILSASKAIQEGCP